jgi:hypothetical protein
MGSTRIHAEGLGRSGSGRHERPRCTRGSGKGCQHQCSTAAGGKEAGTQARVHMLLDHAHTMMYYSSCQPSKNMLYLSAPQLQARRQARRQHGIAIHGSKHLLQAGMLALVVCPRACDTAHVRPSGTRAHGGSCLPILHRSPAHAQETVLAPVCTTTPVQGVGWLEEGSEEMRRAPPVIDTTGTCFAWVWDSSSEGWRWLPPCLPTPILCPPLSLTSIRRLGSPPDYRRTFPFLPLFHALPCPAIPARSPSPTHTPHT